MTTGGNRFHSPWLSLALAGSASAASTAAVIVLVLTALPAIALIASVLCTAVALFELAVIIASRLP